MGLPCLPSSMNIFHIFCLKYQIKPWNHKPFNTFQIPMGSYDFACLSCRCRCRATMAAMCFPWRPPRALWAPRTWAAASEVYQRQPWLAAPGRFEGTSGDAVGSIKNQHRNRWGQRIGKIETGTTDVPMKIMGLSCNFSLNSIHWLGRSWWFPPLKGLSKFPSGRFEEETAMHQRNGVLSENRVMITVIIIFPTIYTYIHTYIHTYIYVYV